jgi:hypothetical protein
LVTGTPGYLVEITDAIQKLKKDAKEKDTVLLNN